MLDIGLGELLLIAVLALLVFGPDRLPKAAAEAARTLRGLRAAATSARRDLAEAAGLDQDEQLAQTVRDLRDLHPRRVLTGLLDDQPGPAVPPRADGGRPANGGRPAAGPAAAGHGASAEASGAAPGKAAGGGDPAGGPPAQPPAPSADPDWT